jgi:hypothetical protein
MNSSVMRAWFAVGVLGLYPRRSATSTLSFLDRPCGSGGDATRPRVSAVSTAAESSREAEPSPVMLESRSGRQTRRKGQRRQPSAVEMRDPLGIEVATDHVEPGIRLRERGDDMQELHRSGRGQR